MPLFTIKYINYTRKHQFDIPEAKFLQDLSFTQSVKPNAIHQCLIVWSDDFGPGFPKTAESELVFATVKGTSDGDHFILKGGIYDLQIGEKDVTVTVVYATFFELYYENNNDPYTRPYYLSDIKSPPGFFIDAYDINKQSWIENDFVNIYSQNVLELTATSNANKLGIFLSNFPATLQAINVIGSSHFLKWIVLRPWQTDIISTSVIDLKEASDGFVFALYVGKESNRPVPNDTEFEQLLNKNHDILLPNAGPLRFTPGVAVDGGGIVIGPDGKPQPIDPWGPLKEQFLKVKFLIRLAETIPGELGERQRVNLANQLEVMLKTLREMDRK